MSCHDFRVLSSLLFLSLRPVRSAAALASCYGISVWLHRFNLFQSRYHRYTQRIKSRFAFFFLPRLLCLREEEKKIPFCEWMREVIDDYRHIFHIRSVFSLFPLLVRFHFAPSFDRLVISNGGMLMNQSSRNRYPNKFKCVLDFIDLKSGDQIQ